MSHALPAGKTSNATNFMIWPFTFDLSFWLGLIFEIPAMFFSIFSYPWKYGKSLINQINAQDISNTCSHSHQNELLKLHIFGCQQEHKIIWWKDTILKKQSKELLCCLNITVGIFYFCCHKLKHDRLSKKLAYIWLFLNTHRAMPMGG